MQDKGMISYIYNPSSNSCKFLSITKIQIIMKKNLLFFLPVILVLGLCNFTSLYGQLAIPDQNPVVIDFNGFDGSGFAASPAAGQLNSNEWIVNGLSDGDLAFGADGTSGDYARGSSTGGVTSGGVYAFDVDAGNIALGVQATGTDWSPGDFILRIQNTSGLNIIQLDISYSIWVDNNADRANSFNFSHSPDNSSYTAEATLDYTSLEALDANGWTETTRNITLSSLVISNNDFYYLKWTGDDVSGSGSRDEFGLDDISITATTSAAGDTDPPVFTAGYPKTDDVRDIRFDVVVNMDEPGTVYYLVKDGGDPAPTNEEVREGDTLVVEMAGSDYSETVTPVTAATDYDIYFLAEDDEATPNVQVSATKVSVTTAAARAIELTFPVGGETFYVGDTIEITWTSANIDSVSLFAWIVEEEETFWVNVLDSNLLASTGSFDLPVPLDAGVDSVLLKLTDSQDTTFSSKSGFFYLTDTIEPMVEGLAPYNGAMGVGQDLQLVIDFNEWIEPGTGNITLKKSDGTTVETIDVNSDMVDIGYNTVEIMLSQYLEKNTAYYVIVDQGAFVDFQDNEYPGILGESDWAFTTIGQDLYFSEYIEGGSSRKALEIHNPTDAGINLDNYRIAQASNGNGWQYYHYFPASTVLDPDDLWVIITDDTDFDTMTVFNKADADEIVSYPGVVYHNGNDARAIEKTLDGGESWFIIDVFGHPDSSENFDVAGVKEAALDHTIWRKDIFTEGNVDWWASAGTDAWNSEWIVRDNDDFSNLGKLTPKSDSLADIKSFVLSEQHSPAVIDSAAATVDIVVVMDTKLDSLFPVITVSQGARIEPASGDSVDFSKGPVVYTVTSADRKNVRNWTVTVTEYQIPSSENKILSFVLANETGDAVIDTVAFTVTAEVAYGTDLSALEPTIEVSAGATISPESGVARDFSAGAVTYTVTAQDASTQDWTVTVTAQQPTEVANITALRAGNQDGTLYKLTGEAILTAQMSFMNKKYIQDADAGILIFDPDGVITTIYDVGDGIKNLTGTLDEYMGMTEFVPIEDPGAASSTGNTLTPLSVSISDLKSNFDNYESRLISIDGAVSFEDAGGTFANGTNYNIFNSTDTTVLRTDFYDTDLTGTPIPAMAMVTGIAIEYGGTAEIAPRKLGDVEAYGVSVKPVRNTMEILVYPNPSDGRFTMEWKGGNTEDLHLEILSMNGKVIYRDVYPAVSTIHRKIDLGIVPAGMYLLRARTDDQVSVYKLVIR